MTHVRNLVLRTHRALPERRPHSRLPPPWFKSGNPAHSNLLFLSGDWDSLFVDRPTIAPTSRLRHSTMSGLVAKKNFVWTCNKDTKEQEYNDEKLVAIMRIRT